LPGGTQETAQLPEHMPVASGGEEMKRLTFRSVGPCLVALACLAGAAAPRGSRVAFGQPAAPVKQTFMVAMRDGVKLATELYLPEGKAPFPVVRLRSPYNKGIPTGLGGDGARHGFAVVIQDTRGRFASEGENLPFANDGWGQRQDGADTAEWIAAQPWCDGK